MTTFSDTFTQGGQTQIHKLRMIRQVIGTTVKAGLWVFAITFALFVWSQHTWQDFWFLLCYLKAHVRVEYCSFCPNGFWDESWIVYVNGQVQTISDYSLIHSESYTNLKSFILLSVFRQLVYSLLISSVSVVVVSCFWVKMGRKKQATKILSGFECVSSKDLRKLVLQSKSSPYRIGNVPLPEKAEFQHMMVTGTTGAGKSNMIHHLLQQIREQGDQAIIVDTMGGIFSRFYDKSKDILLNPLDQRSAQWNLWEEVTNDYILDEIAEAMIPDNRSLESFWTQGARQLLSESIRFLRNDKSRSYQELIQMTLTLSLSELQRRLIGTTVSAMLDPAIDKTALSVRASLANNLRVIKDLEDTEKGISLLNFMKKDYKSWLFLSCQPDQRSFLKPLFSTWLTLTIKGLMGRPENNKSRTWIIIDELASLNRLPSLLTGLAEIRKYGGCFVLGFQDINQIEDIYGVSNSKTLSNLTGTKVLFRAVDTDVAARVARYLGEQEKEETSESISFGAHQMRDGVNLSHQKQTKPVANASQIMQLKDLEAYLKFPGNFPVAKMTFSYLSLEKDTPVYIAKSKMNEKTEKDKEDKVDVQASESAVILKFPVAPTEASSDVIPEQLFETETLSSFEQEIPSQD